MANLNETAIWEAGIYQWETSDPVQGGPNGIDNKPTRQLANRTVWLKTEIAKAVQSIGQNKNEAAQLYALKTTSLTAGAGLTGGGVFRDNMTLALGTPGTCSGSTTNWAGSNTHTHQLAAASPTVAGVAKLINNLTTNDSNSALSAAQGKKLNEDKLNKTDLKFYRVPVLSGSQAVTLDLTNRQSIIDNFGDKYIVFGHLQMVLHNNADNHRITGLPLDNQKGAVQLDFCLMGGFSFIDCHYVALNRTFRTHVNWNNEALQLKWKENLNEDNGLRSRGNQTLLNGRFTVQTENNNWAQIAAKSAGDGWIFEVGPEGEGQFTRRRKDAFGTHTGNIAVYKLPAGGTGTHVLATESQIGFVKPVIKPATSEIIDLTKKSEILAYAGTSGNKHIQLTFYNNAASQIVGLPIEDKSPCQMDISIMGAYTVCRVYYFYLRREFVSSVNWNGEELSYRWDETANKNTAVMLAGNQEISGKKTFNDLTDFARGIRISSGSQDRWFQLGFSDVAAFLKNPVSNKELRLGNDGLLNYQGDKIMLGSDKSDAVNLDDSNKIATAKAVKIVNDKITNAVPSGAVLHFDLPIAPPGWYELNGAAVPVSACPGLVAARYVGNSANATAEEYYKCTNPSNPSGSRNVNGTHIKLPDRRGEFLRAWDHGRGVDAGRQLGSAQGDAIRNIKGQFQADDEVGVVTRSFGNDLMGAFRSERNHSNGKGHDSNGGGGDIVSFDASRVVPTASENRPRNIALMLCIKA